MTRQQPQWNITAEVSLDAGTLAQAKTLSEEVCRTDGITLKLDWEFAEERTPGRAANFCCRTDGRLVGYALLEGDGRELEFTAAVSPMFRRQGILTSLLEAVRQEAGRRDAARLLLVSYRGSASGAATTLALGLAYDSSEYRMEADAAAMPPLPGGLLGLEAVEAADAAALAQMLALTFEREPSPPEALAARLQEPGVRYFFAVLNGVRIGQIGVVTAEGSLYLRGVGILPEYRRRGLGSQLLAAALRQMLREGQTFFTLDVATDNPQALSLYRSCGFGETTIYDYYDVPTAKLA